MRCAKAMRLISERLDGRLDAGESEALAGHLSQCASCAELSRRFAGLGPALAKWTAPPVPPALKERIVATAARPARSSQEEALLRWKAVATAAAIFVVVALILIRPAPVQAPRNDAAPEEAVVYVSPDLPPDVAELAVKVSPALSRNMAAWGGRVGPSLLEASSRLTAGCEEASGVLDRSAGRFMNEQVPALMEGLERTLPRFKPPREKLDDGRLNGPLPTGQVAVAGHGTAAGSAVEAAQLKM